MAIFNLLGSEINSAYLVDGDAASILYDIDGNEIFSPEVDYTSYTGASLFTIGVGNCQGIAIYNNVLFQFRALGSSVVDTVCLFDLTDGSNIYSNMAIESDHGDSATFSDEFYAAGDEFPLIYVTADTTPAVIYVDRVTRTGATLVKTLVFPSSAGYYGAGAFDWDNNICYLLSYKENNYTSDNSGANTTVISKWDLSNLTNNGDGTYTPAFISQYERDFIYCMQGLAYHDDMIWIASGYGGNQSYIYAISPDDGTILYTIDLETTVEVEGLDFISNTEMIVGFQGGIYKKYTFQYK